MTSSIFQLDWITIDINIIILLILLLIGAKILKELYRWRFFFTITSTYRRIDSFLDINPKSSAIPIKKCTLTMSSEIRKEKGTKPTIILIKRNRKLMLLKALTEALCTFGYIVINVKVKTLADIRKFWFAPELEQELSDAIPSILKFYSIDVDIGSNTCTIIDITKKFLPHYLLLKNLDCISLILINPELNSINLDSLMISLSKFKRNIQLITIFSEKLNLFLKNKNVKKIFSNNVSLKNTKYSIIQKAKSTFKYYETVLLSTIIRYIEK
jgi:hypothetical protein